MKLIVGLGNPGEEFKKTRHNVGFLTVDKIVKSFQFSIFRFQSIFNAQISKGIMNGEKYILIKPQTFMNESGKAVWAVLNYYKIKPEDIIVIHDDLDIPLGKYKISKNKNSGGHNGVKSIIGYLRTKDFMRFRIGIAIENKKTPIEKFVLEKFSKKEMKVVEKVIDEIYKNISIQF